MQWYEILIIAAVALGSYFIGNINFAGFISRLKKKDIRKMGSGNPGTMNMFRNFGIPLGLTTMILEILKGVVPAVIGWAVIGQLGFGQHEMRYGITMAYNMPRLGIYVAGFSVILGHVFPVTVKFKGGKGIATAIGVGLVAQPAVAVIALALGIGFIIWTKIGSIGSFIIISLPLAIDALVISRVYYALRDTYGVGSDVVAQHFPLVVASLALIFALFSLTIFTHRKNVVKLFNGTESKTIFFGKNKSVNQTKAKEAATLAASLETNSTSQIEGIVNEQETQAVDNMNSNKQNQ